MARGDEWGNRQWAPPLTPFLNLSSKHPHSALRSRRWKKFCLLLSPSFCVQAVYGRRWGGGVCRCGRWRRGSATLETAISFTQGTAWGRGLFQGCRMLPSHQLTDSPSCTNLWPAVPTKPRLQPRYQTEDLECSQPQPPCFVKLQPWECKRQQGVRKLCKWQKPFS